MSENRNSPEAVVKRQLDAYNAKDLVAWGDTYAENAVQYEFPANVLAQGREAIKARTQTRFQEPDLHADLLQRTVMGNIVIDHEVVTRNLTDGLAKVELVCIYCVENGFIQNASFVMNPSKPVITLVG